MYKVPEDDKFCFIHSQVPSVVDRRNKARSTAGHTHRTDWKDLEFLGKPIKTKVQANRALITLLHKLSVGDITIEQARFMAPLLKLYISNLGSMDTLRPSEVKAKSKAIVAGLKDSMEGTTFLNDEKLFSDG